MRAARVLAATLLVSLLVAGCGSQENPGAASAAAEIAPASAAFYASVVTEGEQWDNAAALVERVPLARRALGAFLDELERHELDWSRDVEPALGPEVAIVGFADGRVVALTEPRDREALEALVEKAGDDVVLSETDGWAVLAESSADIDAFETARDDESLSESEAWGRATDGLPEGALVTGFVNGERLSDELRRAEDEDELGALMTTVLPGGRFPAVGFALGAEDEGVRLDSDLDVDAEELPDPYSAELPDDLPGGAVAYVSWNDVAGHIRDALRRAGDANPEIDRYVAQAELALGVSLDRDLLPLFEGEGALALYPFEPPEAGQGMGWSGHPSVALVLEVDDEERALALVDRIADGASNFLGSVERTPNVTVDGVEARVVSLEGSDVLYAATDGKLVVTTSEPTLAAILRGEDTLADDPSFADARDGAGAPDETLGFAYLDVNALFGAFSGEGGDEVDGLGPLFVYGASDDGDVAVEGFLSVE